MQDDDPDSEGLDRSDWDFSDVEDSELEAVFFEEYVLHSVTIRKWVDWLVDLEAGGKWFLSFVNCRRNREDPKWEPELSNNEVKRFKALPFREQIIAVAMFSNRLPGAGVLRTGEGRADIMAAFENEEYLILEKFSHWREGFAKVEIETNRNAVIGFLGNGEKRLGRMTSGSQNFVLSIPNYMSKEAILRVFAEELDRHWPARLDMVYRRASSFNWRGQRELPFSQRTALGWLGVLRRFECCGSSWVRYLRMYPESGDVYSVKRKLREQCKKAREIIKWFDACGRGEIKSVNNARTIKWTEGKGS